MQDSPMSRFIESILIPTDGSDGALTGAKRGIALASRTDSDLHILSVVESRLSTADFDESGRPPLEEEAEEAVEEIAGLAAEYDADLDVTTRIR